MAVCFPSSLRKYDEADAAKPAMRSARCIAGGIDWLVSSDWRARTGHFGGRLIGGTVVGREGGDDAFLARCASKLHDWLKHFEIGRLLLGRGLEHFRENSTQLSKTLGDG